MKKFLTASKDTTLYEAFPTINVGLDEILEIGKVIDTSVEVTSSTAYSTGSARTLIYFDLPTTASVFSGSNFYLNLKLANAENIRRNQQIIIYQVSRSWDEGSGFFYQNVENVNDGATWRQASGSLSWSMYGGDFLTGATTQSITLSQYPLQDIRVDVTNIIRPLVSQSLQSTFRGLALQFPISDELDVNNKGVLKIFSTQTHTIYQPTLEITWNDQIFSTGSLQAIPSTLNVKIIPSNLKQTYTQGDVTRVSLVVRDEYPLKSFDSILRYKNKYYLPTSSYYSIVDVESNTTVMQFDDSTRVNTDNSGSYVVLDTTSLYPGRFYTLKLKVASGSYSRVFNTDTVFQIDL
jgi:hypothetical protein